MNDLTRVPDDGQVASEGNEQIDAMLGRYFRSVVPKPWPACPQTVVASQSPWSRSKTTLTYRRLGLVAATLGLIVGYHALLGSLPDPRTSSGIGTELSAPIGMRIVPGKLANQPLDGKPADVDVQIDPKKVIPK